MTVEFIVGCGDFEYYGKAVDGGEIFALNHVASQYLLGNNYEKDWQPFLEDTTN